MTKAKWYVYRLIDPRDGSAFYVGKGCRDRIAQHEKDAAAQSAKSRKLDRIRDIWAAEAQVQREHIAYFWNEQDAYDHETDLIGEIGLENLTNVLPGGQKAWERRQAERQARRGWTPMEAAKAISSRNAWGGLALWMRVDAGAEVELNGQRLHVLVWKAAIEALFPSMWAGIEQSREAVEFCRPHLARYGVELVHA